ncbi:MAG: PTS system mannose/fructose/sorbose family transporter subunit IID [Deltaproteobacteria bacterium]|jgi:mannose/fructose/N-acetylgalactosamine-specific phosphotransferase system component IID|nr:PTS system mannose/fructose/sorbose family transporter subunit IID [Deltaproteobacteria bacterium]
MQAERPASARRRTAVLKAALRSLFLESSWNDDGQQNLGRAWAEAPALRELGAEGNLEPSRLLGPFNTNPIACGLVLGASLSLEAEAAAGRGRPRREREEIVASLASAAGAVGDQLYWNTWLPFSSLCGFLAVWATGSWAAAFILPALFCLAAVPGRFLGFLQGWERGKDACSGQTVTGLLSFRRRLHSLVLFLAGAATVLALDGIEAAGGAACPPAWLFAAVFLLATAGGAAAARGRPPLKGPLYLAQLTILYLLFALACPPWP